MGRRFTKAGAHPYDLVSWERRDASIGNEKGELIFQQKDVEFPVFWSQMATNVAVSKYFHGPLGTPERERSLRTVISRVVDTITDWGMRGGYFASRDDGASFQDELTHLLLHQMAAFNSPVWFNVGIEAKPQCSACFINSVQDNMESILALAKVEGMLFKWGSGTGSNLSPIRSSRERLSSGGTSSGPVSFMKGYDAFAGVIKSGGKTRRAAKMTILNIDHPDIVEFINCKAEEEKKAWTLINAGYDGSITGEAYSSVFFQNSNISVRVTDEFMQAVIADGDWQTRSITTGQVVSTHRARDLMKMITESAHICGDPGLQFDSTVNAWHTSSNTDRIYASNPCVEFMFLDDTACNLASLNLMKFRTESGDFDVESFRHACAVLITAQEILVGNASYPTPAIAQNSHDYRPLGLGYANLGALLMANGLPYDSDRGRAYAGAITAIMTGAAYKQSAEIARQIGPFPGYHRNREPMLAVMQKHADAVKAIDRAAAPCGLVDAAEETWSEALSLGARFGYRNAQATVLAPTGTIGFMMDCDTTGVEPDIALVKYKKLVGGGLLKIVNNTVPEALRKLGYSPNQITEIIDYVDSHETIEGAPGLLEEHLAVFDCAFKPVHGVRSIHHMGHVKMMAVVQPFISGAISKTVNMPTDSTPADIEEAYTAAWKLGLKAIAVYRDGSKRTQPLSTGSPTEVVKEEIRAAAAERPARRRLPDERQALTHKFSIGGHEGYITVGMYEDGTPGEVFITMSKEGSVVSGLMDGFATAISMALQYGVPLEVLCSKFSHMRFEPSGFTNNKEIPIAKSVLDYIFRWMSLKFLVDKTGADASVSAAAGGRGRGDANGEAAVRGGDAEATTGNGGGAVRGDAVQGHAAHSPASPGNGGGGNGGNGGKKKKHDIWSESDGGAEGFASAPSQSHLVPASVPTSHAHAAPAIGAAQAPTTMNDLGTTGPINITQSDSGLRHVTVGPTGGGRLPEGLFSFSSVLQGIEAREKETFVRQADSPPCQECGTIMVRNGACYKCPNCGSVFGCS
jgi:ribonucleoside-diphosphate reductase alpha chain